MARIVEPPWDAEGDGEVEGPDKDTVHALDGDDLLYMLKAAGGLALGYEQGVLVGPGHVAGHAAARNCRRGPSRRRGSGSSRGCPRGANLAQETSFSACSTLSSWGTISPAAPASSILSTGLRLDLVDAHEGREAGACGGADELGGVLCAYGAVLDVDDDVVQARVRASASTAGALRRCVKVPSDFPPALYFSRNLFFMLTPPA